MNNVLKSVGISLGVITALGVIGLGIQNQWAHFQAEITIERNIAAMKKQAANSTSVVLATNHVRTLTQNVEALNLADELSVFFWEEDNPDYSVALYKARLYEALLTLENEQGDPTETVRVIQAAFTDMDGTISLPNNMAKAYRWGGNYTLSKYVYDIFFNGLTAVILITLLFLIVSALILQ